MSYFREKCKPTLLLKVFIVTLRVENKERLERLKVAAQFLLTFSLQDSRLTLLLLTFERYIVLEKPICGKNFYLDFLFLVLLNSAYNPVLYAIANR